MLNTQSDRQTDTTLKLPTVPHIPPAAPPPPYTTSILIATSKMAAGGEGWEKEISNNLDRQRSDGTYHTGTSAG
jgi:hypothetical protein